MKGGRFLPFLLRPRGIYRNLPKEMGVLKGKDRLEGRSESQCDVGIINQGIIIPPYEVLSRCSAMKTLSLELFPGSLDPLDTSKFPSIQRWFHFAQKGTVAHDKSSKQKSFH
jgi:hypothetical protein